MAKYERYFQGDFDTVLERIHNGILSGSFSASYEDGSDFAGGGARCAVRVYERYSAMGGNRVSLNVMLTGVGCSSPPLPPVGARPCFSRSIPLVKRLFSTACGKLQNRLDFIW